MARNKYRNVPTVVDGIRFASKAEAKRWSELKLLERANKIKGLERQPRFPIYGGLFRLFTYVGDFSYYESGNKRLVVEDVKGKETDVFRIKWKAVNAAYPGIDWRIVKVRA